MTFKRAAIAAAAAFALTTSAAAEPVDGQAELAIHNTILQAMLRGGYAANSEAVEKTLEAVHQAIVLSVGAGGPCATLGCTWNQVIKGLADYLPWPFIVGKEGERFQGDGGDYGGAGASCGDNCFPDKVFKAGRDCGDIEYNFDPQGNFIIPSYFLDTGGPVAVGPQGGGDPYHYASNPVPSLPWVTGSTPGAAARRQIHNINMQRIPQAWYGVIGPTTPAGCFAFATVAYRNTAGGIQGRTTVNVCTNATALLHGPSAAGEENATTGQVPHKSCPEGAGGSADLHFYGINDFGSHWHGCTMYYPNFQLSPSGYAVNEKTSVPFANVQNWPKDMPGFIKQCSVDPTAVKKIAQALWKKAAAQPGYDGAPPQTITDADSRPGPLKVEDLADAPGDSPQPTPDPNAPAPTPTPGTSTGSTDVCDFGPGGCDDPGTATPELDEPPTDFMAPIFDWLPDLPSLEFNTASAQCPTWDVNLTSYLGSTAQYTLDSHCPLVEQNSAALGALMLAIWGVMAAMIILRA